MALPVKIGAGAVVNVVLVVLHSKEFVAILAPVEFKLVERLYTIRAIVNKPVNIFTIISFTLMSEQTRQALKLRRSLGTVSTDISLI